MLDQSINKETSPFIYRDRKRDIDMRERYSVQQYNAASQRIDPWNQTCRELGRATDVYNVRIINTGPCRRIYLQRGLPPLVFDAALFTTLHAGHQL